MKAPLLIDFFIFFFYNLHHFLLPVLASPSPLCGEDTHSRLFSRLPVVFPVHWLAISTSSTDTEPLCYEAGRGAAAAAHQAPFHKVCTEKRGLAPKWLSRFLQLAWVLCSPPTNRTSSSKAHFILASGESFPRAVSFFSSGLPTAMGGSPGEQDP